MKTIDIIRNIRTASRAISVRFEAITGSTVRHLLVLQVLHEYGDLIQSRVGEISGIDRSTMTTVVTKLVSEGLVRVDTVAEDNRAKLLHITAKGTERLAKLHEALDRLFGDQFGLADKQASSLVKLLTEVSTYS